MSERTLSKMAHNWRDQDFVAWAKGDAVADENLRTPDILKEAAKRFELDAQDGVAKVKAQIREQGGPRLKSPKSTPVVPTEAKSTEAGAQAPSAPVTQPSEKLTAEQRDVQERLERYYEMMCPGKMVNGDTGAKAQRYLLQQFKLVLGQEGQSFVQQMDILLKFVYDHRDDVFNERYIMRFLAEGAFRTRAEEGQFERLVNLFTTTCDKRTRQLRLRQVDVRSSMRGFDQITTDKVVEYFKH